MRYGRRLFFMVMWLAALDQFVPAPLQTLERDRYETGETFRFENSDVFALGPQVAYLRDHPRGERPRVGFFGNSVMWGYGLTASATVPARYQALKPDAKVFNFGVNGYELGSAYLIAKATVDSLDQLFVQISGPAAAPVLASLIPVDDDDARAFQLARPQGFERRLQALAGSWQLYGATYRLQAAALGMSSRQYVYLHKGEMARGLLSRMMGRAPLEAPAAAPLHESEPIEVVVPRAVNLPDEERRRALRTAHPLLWNFAELIRRHRKQTVFLLFGQGLKGFPEQDVADLNVLFAPFGEIVLLRIPASLVYDGIHLTPSGAHGLARALVNHEPSPTTRRQ